MCGSKLGRGSPQIICVVQWFGGDHIVFLLCFYSLGDAEKFRVNAANGDGDGDGDGGDWAVVGVGVGVGRSIGPAPVGAGSWHDVAWIRTENK